MGRQYRPPRQGFGSKLVTGYGGVPSTAPNPGATTGHVIWIPNYGVTDVSTFAAGEYTMDAPTEGVRKTLFFVSSSSAAVVVRLSTATSVKVGHSAATQITLGLTTVDSAIELVGVNSTRWAIVSMTVPSTATGWTGSTVASVTFQTS